MKKIIGLMLIILFYAGCEKIDVPVFSDSDEIERFLEESDFGKIFFSTENLISDLPYNYPFDTTAYYVDLVDSIDREVIAFFPLKQFGEGFNDPIQEFGPPFGSSQDAEVEVRDRVYARTIRVEGVDTTLVNELVFRDYSRFGYFMKLGDDGQRYSGWLLRGFNGGAAERNTHMSMYHENNEWFSGDTFSYQHYESAIMGDIIKEDPITRDTIVVFDTIEHYITRNGYLLLNDNQTTNPFIEQVSLAEKLRAEVTSTNLGVFYTMSYVTSTDTILKNFNLNNNSKFEVFIQTPTVNNKTWDFIYFQEFTRDPNDTTAVPRFQTFKRRNWVIPFKVE